MGKPVLLLDVDGVLALQQRVSGEFALHRVTSSAGNVHEVWLNRNHGVWLRMLHEVFDIVWTTGWEYDAPRILGQILSVPEFPVLVFSERPQLGTRLDKLPDVADFVGDRPVAWLDDDVDEAIEAWAHRRTPATLLVQPDSSRGLQASEVSKLLLFAANHRPDPEDVRHRAGVILVENNSVAMIERHRAGATYFVVPGGGAEPGETIEQAAKRETLEEISLEVELLGPVGHVVFSDGRQRSVQHFFAASVTSGRISPGSGPEYVAGGVTGRGSYRPVWLPLESIPDCDVRPAVVVSALGEGVDRLLVNPVLVEELASDQG